MNFKVNSIFSIVFNPPLSPPPHFLRFKERISINYGLYIICWRIEVAAFTQSNVASGSFSQCRGSWVHSWQWEWNHDPWHCEDPSVWLQFIIDLLCITQIQISVSFPTHSDQYDRTSATIDLFMPYHLTAFEYKCVRSKHENDIL